MCEQLSEKLEIECLFYAFKFILKLFTWKLKLLDNLYSAKKKWFCKNLLMVTERLKFSS